MPRSAMLSSTLLASIVFAGPGFAVDEPTLRQVYQAAESGRLNDAQGMMSQVLRDHPNSGKVHFVESELLAKEGFLANAAAELRAAERLAPGLPFANPQTVENLKQRIASSRISTQPVPSAHGGQFELSGRISLGLLLAVSALITAIIFLARKLSQRNASASAPGGGSMHGTRSVSSASVQANGAGGGTPPTGPAAGGIGSGILGGLATGAALGAGMVAGEALMRRFAYSNRHELGQTLLPAATDQDIAANDIGSAGFGVADVSSWDDSSGGCDRN